MPVPVIPTKTALGQEELRRRTGGLGQRHRTILFLIDGRRPLSEVLSLALKAGAATSHFEDLVRLGYVEMPPEEFAETVPAPAMDDAPGETDEPRADVAELTHVELTVPADDTAGVAAVVPETVSETVLLTPAVQHDPDPDPDPEPAPAPEVAREAEPVPAPIPARVATPAPVPVPAPPPIVLPPPPPPMRSPVAQAVEELVDENEPLGKIRRCLLDALYMDPTPFGFRAAMRVRTARTAAAMVEIIWEMERDMSHASRSRNGLQNLQRARELLGLGNTLVDEDSQSGPIDDSAW